MGLEGRVARRLLVGGGELVERRDERLGDEPASVRAEACLDAHPVILLVAAPPSACTTAAKKSRSL